MLKILMLELGDPLKVDIVEVEDDIKASDDEVVLINYDIGDEWDADLDTYESGHDSVVDSDEDTSEGAQEVCKRYEANSRRFVVSAKGSKISIMPKHLHKSTDELRKVVKVLIIKNGFRLQRVNNEKVRVLTLK